MPHTELIALAKDGDYIEVHPTTLENHMELGWRACDRREVAEPAADDATAPKPKGKKNAAHEPAAADDAEQPKE